MDTTFWWVKQYILTVSIKIWAIQQLSEYQDTGDAIAQTEDGHFVLAGSMLSTPTGGCGGKDILLIKLDPLETLNGTSCSADPATKKSVNLWNQGSWLVGLRTNTINGLSTIFIMKTDKAERWPTSRLPLST